MGTPMPFNNKHLSLFTQTFNVLLDILSEWQINKGVTLHLWDAIDCSDLEQLVRMFLLETLHQLETAAQVYVGYSEESKYIMHQREY